MDRYTGKQMPEGTATVVIIPMAVLQEAFGFPMNSLQGLNGRGAATTFSLLQPYGIIAGNDVPVA